MKKILGMVIVVIVVITLSGCSVESSEEKVDALVFKEEYESLNATTNASGKEHRSVSILEDNPFVYASADDIVEKMNNDETFYVYFGSKLCPWCRSVIEKAIEVANQNGIETIYYVEIWDNDGKEVLRDTYAVENGEAIKTLDGTESYDQLLDLLNNVLSDYSLTDDEGNAILVGEKRIYAPTFIYVEDGVAVRTTDGISEKLTDSRAELTSEILEDEEYLFREFFD